MGYTSQIKIATKEDNIPFITAFDAVNEKHHYFTKEAKDRYGTKLVVYSADDVKWYDDYTSVQEYMEVIENDDYSDSIDYVRVGEDTDDRDERNGNGWIYPIVTIGWV